MNSDQELTDHGLLASDFTGDTAEILERLAALERAMGTGATGTGATAPLSSASTTEPVENTGEQPKLAPTLVHVAH